MEYYIISDFPLLSVSEDLKKWSGFITTKGRAMLISIVAPKFPSAEDVYLKKDDLSEELQKYWIPIIEQVSKANVSLFLEYLKTIERHVLPQDADVDAESLRLANLNLYSNLIEEIEIIGTKNIAHLSSDFKELVIKQLDRSGREHFLKISISSGYPEEEPTVVAELPIPEEQIKWPSSIKEINKKFLGYLTSCRKFWDDMDDFDDYVKVIEPIQPNRSHYHRKVLLEKNVAVHLTFNALFPRQIPGISFSGPKELVDEYNRRIDLDVMVWDQTNTVVQNLRGILECSFVTAALYDEDPDADAQPCAICFVYEFDGEIPEIRCICGSPYHQPCKTSPNFLSYTPTKFCRPAYHEKCVHDLYVYDGSSKNPNNRSIECPSCQVNNLDVPRSNKYAGAITW